MSIVGALDRVQAQALVQRLLARLPRAALPTARRCPPCPMPSRCKRPCARTFLAAAQAQVLIGQLGAAARPGLFWPCWWATISWAAGFYLAPDAGGARKARPVLQRIQRLLAGAEPGAASSSARRRARPGGQAVQVARHAGALRGRRPHRGRAARRQDNLIGGFALRIDSNRKLLANVANIAWNDLPLDYLEHWTARVNALSLAEVRAAMQRHLQPARMATVIVGAALSGPARRAKPAQGRRQARGRARCGRGAHHRRPMEAHAPARGRAPRPASHAGCVRETLFNWLGRDLTGWRCLDALPAPAPWV